MTRNRIFLLSVGLIVSSYATPSRATDNTHLEQWQTTYLNNMSPEELQFTANFLYLSYAIALVESKMRQFSTPISQLNQSIRINIATYKNAPDDLAMLKTLIDRLSYVIGTRSIYIETLNTYSKHYGNNTTPTIHAALEDIKSYAQDRLRAWADEKAPSTAEQLKKSYDEISRNTQYLISASGIHKGMSEGAMPIEIPAESEINKSLITLDIILNNNSQLLTVTENLANVFNETSDHAAQIITVGAEIYKQYYATIYSIITLPTSDKRYATTLFGMHDALPEEYKSLLPHPDRVFEHMLQTTKLYTQTELLQQQ
jgi:hypothetical protein